LLADAVFDEDHEVKQFPNVCIGRVSATATATATATVALAMASIVAPAAAERPNKSRPAVASVTAPDPAIERRVEDFVARMTLEEKVSLLSGANRFATAAIPRLGIPALRMADGPNGMRTDDTSSATVFPASVAMAATWNPQRAREVGRAIGEEAIAKNYQIVLGPAMNIQRVPLGGRNFEYFSEDPYLTGEIAVGWTQGLRSTGRLTTPKHFAANNQENERKRMNVRVSERALREIYLPAFHEVVTRADPGMVMTAYNKVNGQYASENSWLLRTILKGEWGFDGAVVSDFGAVHSTAPVINAGLDLEMPGPPKELGTKLVAAVRSGEVTVATLDGAARRMVRAIIRSGAMDRAIPKGSLDTTEHRAVSRAAALEAITLLKNQGNLLPLLLPGVRSIAVIGPNADVRVIQGGGSSEVNAIRAVTPLEGLKAALPSSVKLVVATGADNNRYPAIADPRFFSTTTDRKDQGLHTAYWGGGKIAGAPIKSFFDDVFMKFRFADEVVANPASELALRSDGYFWPPRDGSYEFELLDLGTGTVTLDGKPIITPASQAAAPPLFDFLNWKARRATVTLKAGRGYRFSFEMLPANGKAAAYRLGIRLPTGTIEEAVRAARAADVALVFVGSSTTSESEEFDRGSLGLYGDQDALVDAVVAANPRTIVILNNGGPLEMPWLDHVPAVVESWFLGGETGHALADVLLGRVSPSGKLPMTFPKRLQDNPTYSFYPGGLDAQYGEDIFVGYRWYDERKIEPLFPFGFGLSYTTFGFDGLRVERAGRDWSVSFALTNTGQRAGAQVAQVYVGMPSASGEPPRQLKSFEKVMLQPGERRMIKLVLTKRDFSHWNSEARRWEQTPGTYSIEVGSSSRDIALRAPLAIRASL
jgi:beta-glucosidase